MQEQKTATLTTTFSEVLANLAFMFTDEEPEEPSGDDLWLEALITYQGPVNGTLRFRCTRDFSRHLAANLLGLDAAEEITESQANDVAKEFLNIVCGQFVTATHGTEDVFDLTIPEIRELAEMPDLSDTNEVEGEVATMFVEGHPVQLAYTPGV